MTRPLPLSVLLEDLTPQEHAEVAAGAARIIADIDRREAASAQPAPRTPSLRSQEPRAASSRSSEPTRSR